MKTLMRFFSMLLLLMAMSVAFCSCGDDNGIVGTWSGNNNYYSGSDEESTDTYVFKSNGTYDWFCTGTWFSPDYGKPYAYNAEAGMLTLSGIAYLVVTLDKNSLVFMDPEDGDVFYYYRK